MPDSLEYIVRPFSVRDLYGRILIPSTPVGTRERATLEWGAEAEMPPHQEAEGISFNVLLCRERLDELQRQSERKRIYQNGDTSSDNWVDVDRPKTLQLKKKEENKSSLAWTQQDGADQEISAALAPFSAEIQHAQPTAKKGNCAVTWHFTNN